MSNRGGKGHGGGGGNGKGQHEGEQMGQGHPKADHSSAVPSSKPKADHLAAKSASPAAKPASRGAKPASQAPAAVTSEAPISPVEQDSPSVPGKGHAYGHVNDPGSK
jgi:hypothetical protein